MDGVLEVAHRYRLGRVAFQRGLASTYHAHDELLDDEVLVEHIPRLDDTEERRDYIAQYRAVAVRVMRLRHPNVIPIRDFGVDEEGHFVVKQHDPGRSLDSLQLARPQAIEVATGILRGLAVLHHANIVHRDVKPYGIYVVERDGLVPQLDHFHLAVAAELAYLDPELCGTPVYLAPEILDAEGARVYSRASDVYAAGLVCLELVTGRSVVDLARIGEAPPPDTIRSLVDGPMADVLICATRPDPRDRFRDAKTFYESFALNAPMRLARDDDPSSPDGLSNLLAGMPDSELRGELVTAFRILNVDPRMAMTKCRQIAEVIAQAAYRRGFGDPRSRPLVNLVDDLHAAGRVPADVFTHFYNVRKMGNLAVHGSTPVTVDGVLQALAATVRIVTWHLLDT